MPKILLEEKPVRRALAEVLGLSGETRVELAARRYKKVLSAWSESPLVDLAAGLWASRLKARSEAPWVQLATARYARAMRRVLKE